MPITVLPPKSFPGATVLMILQLAGTTVPVVILPYSPTQKWCGQRLDWKGLRVGLKRG